MTLDFDTTTAPRRPSELAGLVAAVVEADRTDETDWLEWKSALDLVRAEGRFNVARAILGLANRRPDYAQRVCEGYGFVVVGAEPGEVAGVDDVDPAVLDDGLSPYLGGSKGPRWSAAYVRVNGKQVLVVTVDPPQAGDPIFSLRKAFDKAHDGMVFVRRPGKTEPASSADVDYLSDRLLQGSTSLPLALQLDVVGDLPLRWFDLTDVDAAVAEWLAGERMLQVDAAEETERRRREPQHLDVDAVRTTESLVRADLAELAQSLSFGARDTRTLEEFQTEVEEWGERVRTQAVEVLGSRYVARNAIRFVVMNPVERHLADVHVKVHVAGEVSAMEGPPDAEFSPKPRRFGEGQRIDVGLPSLSDFSTFLPPSLGVTRQWLEDGSINFRWNVGDMRPLEVDESDEIFVVLPAPPEGGELVASWEATSPTVDGMVRGTLRIAVAAEAVTARELLGL